MSFTVETLISESQQELNIIGQAVSDSDFMMFVNNTDTYFKSVTKPPTAERMQDLVLYGGVNEYALPSDFDGIIEPRRPYAFHSPDSTHEDTKSQISWPYGFKTSIMFVREEPYLVIVKDDLESEVLNPCDSLTDNGTFSVSGDGSALTLDTQIMVQGSASVRVLVTASTGQTIITATGMDSVDLTDYFTNLLGKFFVYLQCPATNTADVASVALRLGSSASDYYSMSATARFRGDGIGQGWGQIAFNPDGASSTGSPDQTAITYMAVVINHGTTGVNGLYRLDDVIASKGIYYQLPYYSKYNIKAADGTYKERVTATDDTVLTPSPFYEAYKYKVLEMAAASTKINNQAFAAYAARELAPRERYLKAKYPSQEVNTSSTWYRKANRF